MNSNDRLRLVLGEQLPTSRDDAPSDPLNELSHLEMGLWTYCHDHNRQVSVSIGDSTFLIEMLPDVSGILNELPAILASLTAKQDTKLPFDEVSTAIYFQPVGVDVNCIVRHYGDYVQRKEYILKLAQVVEELRNFVQDIVRTAVEDDYITADEAQSFWIGEDNDI